MKKRYIGFGVLLLTLICCLMPALLLYFLGYKATNEWNQAAIQTTCTILRNYVVDDRCSYSCNCRKNSNGGNTCQTCYYTCYNGLIDVDYVVNNDTIPSTIEVYHHFSDRARLQNNLNANYPVSKSVTCYYNPSEPNFVRLNYKNPAVFLAFFIIFCILGCIILIGFVVWAIRNCLCFHHRITLNDVGLNSEKILKLDENESTPYESTPYETIPYESTPYETTSYEFPGPSSRTFIVKTA